MYQERTILLKGGAFGVGIKKNVCQVAVDLSPYSPELEDSNSEKPYQRPYLLFCSSGPHSYQQRRTLLGIISKGSLGYSDNELLEFRILRTGTKMKSKLTTLDFKRVYFGLFRDLLGRVPWDKGMEGRGAQEQSIPTNAGSKAQMSM